MLVSILSIILEIATDIILHIFGKNVLGIKKNNKYLILGMWIMFLGITNAVSLFVSEGGIINMLVYLGCYLAVLLVLYNGGIMTKIIMVISTYTLGVISEVIAVVFFKFILGIGVETITENVNYLTTCNMISKVIWFIFLNILSNIITRKNKYLARTTSWIETFIVPVSSIIIIAFIFLNPDNGIAVKEVITITMILAINISTFYLYEKVQEYIKAKMETQFLEQQSKYYMKQCREIEDLWIYMRAFIHDIKNRYILEKTYFDESKYDLLAGEYSEIINYLSNDILNANTGIGLIDAIINYKRKVCEKNNIHMETNLESLEGLKIKSTDVGLLLGNLIDGAIEEVKQVEANRKIILSMDYMNNSLSIYVENPHRRQEDISDINNSMIDVDMIKSIIDKYNGQISIQDEEDKYIVRVFIMS